MPYDRKPSGRRPDKEYRQNDNRRGRGPQGRPTDGDRSREDRWRRSAENREQERGRMNTEKAPQPRSYRDFEYRQPPRPARAPESFAPAVPAAPSAPPADAAPENLLSGRNPIREALKSGRDIEKLLVQRGELSGSAREIVQMARQAHVVVQEVDKKRLDEITPHHQGLLAFASAYPYATVDEILEAARSRGEAPFLVLLDGVTDPHNLGAIIRSAECAGAHGVIIPERRSVGLTPAAVKASAGAVEYLKVAKVTNLARTIEELKLQNIWTYAATMDGEDFRSVSFEGGTALVIGSEGEGISRLVLEKCDQRVSIPMRGHLDSLNASVAAGILLYRVMNSRQP